MRSTETLGRVDVLCVDKTGTITDNAMKVTEIFASGEHSPDEMKQAESPALRLHQHDPGRQ